MICLICRNAELISGFTSVTLRREEMILTTKSVPAWICPGCGEAYVEEDVAGRLLQAADEASAQGIHAAVREYIPVAV